MSVIQELQEQNMNDFFRSLNIFVKCMKKQGSTFIHCERLLKFDRKEIIIFEADFNKIDLSILKDKKERELIVPMDKMFIEIPKWKKENKFFLLQNLGGIFIFIEIIGRRKLITAYTFWDVYNKIYNRTMLKPISISLFDCAILKKNNSENMNIIGIGDSFKNKELIDLENILGLEESIKKDLANIIYNILLYLLLKVEKKEYTSYKKWTQTGFETKEIIYSYEVSKHKRHFWKDSKRFKIPFMSREELIDKGYDIDEVVFKDGELRRDVPYRIIGNFLVGKDKVMKEDNRRIKLAKARILRQEQKVLNILKELLPDNFIRKHDRKTLKGLELDFNIPEKRLAFEYDGEQHFDRELCERVFKSDFDALKKRDRKKDSLCRRKKIKLIRIKYDEPLTKTHIKNKLKEIGIL